MLIQCDAAHDRALIMFGSMEDADPPIGSTVDAYLAPDEQIASYEPFPDTVPSAIFSEMMPDDSIKQLCAFP